MWPLGPLQQVIVTDLKNFFLLNIKLLNCVTFEVASLYKVPVSIVLVDLHQYFCCIYGRYIARNYSYSMQELHGVASYRAYGAKLQPRANYRS